MWLSFFWILKTSLENRLKALACFFLIIRLLDIYKCDIQECILKLKKWTFKKAMIIHICPHAYTFLIALHFLNKYFIKLSSAGKWSCYFSLAVHPEGFSDGVSFTESWILIQQAIGNWCTDSNPVICFNKSLMSFLSPYTYRIFKAFFVGFFFPECYWSPSKHLNHIVLILGERYWTILLLKRWVWT